MSYLEPGWIEVNLTQLHKNFQLICQDKPDSLALLAVVKDNAYGHGACVIAQVALEHGVRMLAVATVPEALELREHDIHAPILVFGERPIEQFDDCLHYDLTIFINTAAQAATYAKRAAALHKTPNAHIEIDTGLSRYGIRWTEAAEVANICAVQGLYVEGIMSHFAMSDELDKSYALTQLERFHTVLEALQQRGIDIPIKHVCNSGGFLDLPQAHFDMVRIGILPLGVFPSKVCRRIAGIAPIMSVKTRIACLRDLVAGDKVGYGMHYTAPGPRRIAILPFGYGTGYPRVRNRGHVLIHGQPAPILGGNAMDAMMVDVSAIPQAQPGDEVVLMGTMGSESLSVHQLAAWKGSVSYDIFVNWNSNLPRVYR